MYGAIQDLPWSDIWLTDNPVEILTEHLSLLVGRYVPTKVIRVRNKDKSWFDDQCRNAFGLKQEAHHRWTYDRSLVNWEEFVLCQLRANATYSEAKRQFSDRNKAVLMNVHSPHKWWSTLKSAVFSTSSSLPSLFVRAVDWCVSLLVRLICCRIILTKQSSEAVDLPLTCHPSPSLTTFAFRSREVRRLLLDLDPYGGADPLGMFPLFLKRTADVIWPRS